MKLMTFIYDTNTAYRHINNKMRVRHTKQKNYK